jgi:hypothetical protein
VLLVDRLDGELSSAGDLSGGHDGVVVKLRGKAFGLRDLFTDLRWLQRLGRFLELALRAISSGNATLVLLTK